MDDLPRPFGRRTSSVWEGASMSKQEVFTPKCLQDGASRNINGRFIKGPIPLLWIQRACSVGAEKLALYLVYMKGLTNCSTIELSHTEMKGFGLSAKTRRTQLRKLEDAGLVDSEKALDKKPVVTLKV